MQSRNKINEPSLLDHHTYIHICQVLCLEYQHHFEYGQTDLNKNVVTQTAADQETASQTDGQSMSWMFECMFATFRVP